MAKVTDPKGIKQRVMAVADAMHIGHKDMAESIGMTYSNFTGKAQETPLNSNAVASILIAYPSVNARWLLTGMGDMSCDQIDTARMREEEKVMKQTILSQQRTIEKLMAKLKD